MRNSVKKLRRELEEEFFYNLNGVSTNISIVG